MSGLTPKLRALSARLGLSSPDELDLVMSVEGQIRRAEARVLIDLASDAPPGSAPRQPTRVATTKTGYSISPTTSSFGFRGLLASGAYYFRRMERNFALRRGDRFSG